MVNKVILIGRLTADPEYKQTPSGVSVATFTLAVDRDFVGENKERKADFPRVIAWRKDADFVSKYIKKGNLVSVEGSIQTGSYNDKTGNKRFTCDVVASHVGSLEFKKHDDAPSSVKVLNEQNTANAYDEKENSDFQEVPLEDDELPF
jgi:single-strand DNA-binding protein